MIYDILNYSYIFLESIYWGYSIIVVLLLIFFVLNKDQELRNEIQNWQASLNICFILALISTVTNQLGVIFFIEPNAEGALVHPDNLYFILGIIFLGLKGILAIMFLFRKFRTDWRLSVIAFFLINWYKIYYIIDGTYEEWQYYAPNMPGRDYYQLIFFSTLIITYICLSVSGQLPHRSYFLKWMRRDHHVF